MAAPDQATRPPSTGAPRPFRDSHSHRRFFIGPMPEKMFSVSGVVGDAIRRADDGHENGSLSRAMDHHAFQFYMLQGGKLENWNNDTRIHVRADLIRSWRENDWVRRLHRSSRAADRPTRWSGCTFEIGNLLGVNILDKHPQATSNLSAAQIPDHAASAVVDASMAAVTTEPANSSLPSPTRSLSPRPDESGNDIHSSSLSRLLSASATVLSEPSGTGAAAPPPRSILKKGFLARKRNGSNHTIERGITPTPLVQTPPAGDEHQIVGDLPSGGSPSLPDDVLARAGDEIVQSSAGATVDAQLRQPRDDEVILRGESMSVTKFILC